MVIGAGGAVFGYTGIDDSSARDGRLADVEGVVRRATAQAAAAVLDRLAERMPLPVRANSIDNGSDFMAEFETARASRGIRLFVLPPRRPKLHGATHTEETPAEYLASVAGDG